VRTGAGSVASPLIASFAGRGDSGSDALELVEGCAKLARTEVVGAPEGAEHALTDRRVAGRLSERAREDAAPFRARDRRESAAIQPAVDPHVPELVQGFAIPLRVSREIDTGFVIILEMTELVEASLREASRREVASLERRRPGPTRPRAGPGAPTLHRDEVSEREPEPGRAVVMRVPLDVRVIVPVLEVDRDGEIVHDAREAQLPDALAEHGLGRTSQREVGRMPAHAQDASGRRRGVATSHQSPVDLVTK
jgi:hypothetical protein